MMHDCHTPRTAADLPRYDLGACAVTLLDGGPLKLDGGAMFGIVPKPLWARGTPADEQNRIDLACNCLLVEWRAAPERRLLIETGRGAKFGAKEQQILAVDPARWIRPALEAARVDPGSITDIALTHLHFDHAGGLTEDVGGRLRLAFPRARVHVQAQEYEDVRAGFGVMTATYRAENVTPVDTAGAWNLLPGAAEILPGVRGLPTPGHTRGHQSIVIDGGDRLLVFGGDVMPTTAHLSPPYNMAFDLFPLENRTSKHKLLRWVVEQDALLVIAHDPRTPVVRVRPERDWFTLEPVAPNAV